MTSSDTLLDISDLSIDFTTRNGPVRVVDGLTLSLPRGKTVCLVGESGCGKSVTAKSILRVLDLQAKITSGTIRLGDSDITALHLDSPELRAVRGGKIGMIHQEPMSFLSPLYTVGNQIIEALQLHRKIDAKTARAAAIDMLRQVGMPEPETRVDRYVFELSGGQRQRAMIAMALICQPRLLIADEPTTALDVTTQANILDLLRRLQAEQGMAVLFITHDLGVVEEIADEVAVMYLGRIVEQGPAAEVLANPKHPYTRGLLASMPRLDGDFNRPLRAIPGMVPAPANRPSGCPFRTRCDIARAGICDTHVPEAVTVGTDHSAACHALGEFASQFALPATALQPAAVATNVSTAKALPLLRVERLTKVFPIRKGFLERTVGHVRAVSEVSFTIARGETLGLVGESGCGKSTLARTLVGLHRADGGTITFEAEDGPIDIHTAKGAIARTLRRDMRMVFQDPTGSLNPRMRVRDIIGEVLEVNTTMSRAEIYTRVEALLGEVGLSPDYATRYPHAFSGGQRQRIAIARALASNPRLVIADEAVSALDVSVQTQIINLMKRLQENLGLTYLFVSHDLGVIANVSDRVAVMYAGRIVEMGATEAIFHTPCHPYTEALLAAIPGKGRRMNPSLRIEGHAPSGGATERGCAFAVRCRYASTQCRSSVPVLRPTGSGQVVACHRADDLSLASPVRAA
ncbi:ABC transporter ATP-binding protein [Pelagibacterium lentulum]|uniref:Oligopeptide ABC transporter ATP-binding protein OppF n=1 Tax=Pelagibacterium lentulum TaxID=2029865 RepID=A0A916VVH7_9HYPH|nr:ABC transporter ATP-binding protein [Pelagibacterium lentulum]GGA40512.1 oligopeptide ABC transporter ATP-binding protein OppF [Pelagibacterium lentulum]